MEGRTSLLAALGLALLVTGCTTTPGVRTGPLMVGTASATTSSAPPAEPAPPAKPAVVEKKSKDPARRASPDLEVALVAIKEEAAMKKKTEEPETSMRMLDETRQMYQEILKTAPDNQKAQEGLVRVYTSMGEHHKARDIIRKNLDKNPKDARLWVEVGMTYNRQKNIDEALRCFRKATELDPENRQYVKVLGYTLVWAGRVNEGMPHLVRAIGEAPAHYNVAGILARQNHLEDARRHLQITLDLDPDFDRAKDMLTRLRETSPAGAAPSGIAPAGAADLSPTLGFTPLD
ncbi:MAG: tetratricopeptide repeat protein [Gemmataceae bacterium]